MSLRDTLVASFVLALILACSLTPSRLNAQQTRLTATRPAFVAVPEAFPDLDVPVLLIREKGRDVVVLDPEASTVENLAAALHVLARVRERRPQPVAGELIPITGFVFTRVPSREERFRLGELLERLSRRPVGRLGDLGPGRWVPLGGGS